MSRDCRVALPRSAVVLSAVCDCGISLSYSPTIFERVSSEDGSLDMRAEAGWRNTSIQDFTSVSNTFDERV